MARGLLGASIAAALLEGAAGVSSFLRPQAQGQAADACACRSWKEVYTSLWGVRCGAANEYFFATGKHSLQPSEIDELSRPLVAEFCSTFYEVIADNACINVNMGQDKGQWCYVDAACSELAGGAQVNAALSWKTCSSQKDKLTRQMDPPALAQWAGSQGVNLGLLNKMSYPLSEYRWKYISSFWNATMDELTSIPQDLLPGATLADIKEYLRPRWGKRNRHIDDVMMAELKQIEASGVPTTFDTAKDQHPPHVIVQGRTSTLPT